MITAILIISVLITSTVSGVFAMGGGTLLLAVLINLMPVKTAMIYHGVIQFFSNIFRSLLSWRDIVPKVILFYLLGTLISSYFLLQITYQPNKPITLILLGCMLLVGPHLSWANINIESARGAFVCGLIIIVLNTFVGVSGPVLNMFFIKSSLNRYQIIATKSFSQSTAHVFKVIFYTGVLSAAQNDMDILWENPLIYFLALITFIGSWLGKWIVSKMSDRSFKLYGTYLISFFGIGFIIQGIYLLF